MKKLKLFNGRGQPRRGSGNHWRESGHIYLAAYSKADAVRLMRAAGFDLFSLYELNNFFNKSCWGNSMAGITPERGVWAMLYGQDYNPAAKPIRIL